MLCLQVSFRILDVDICAPSALANEDCDNINLQEDLELLSFSDMVPNGSQKHQMEGLPLKAVYRDTVVGIRYLHSRDPGTAPV